MIIGLFSIILVISLAGCGSSNNGSSADGKVSITISWWGDTARNKKYNEIADEFEKENPNIEVKRQFGSWNDYWDKLATQTAGGNAPDVISMHPNYAADYARRNTLLDLDQYIKSGDIDVSNFPKSVVNSGKISGKNYMIAQGVTTSGQVVNKSLFEKIGVDAPGDQWNWDHFVDKAIEVQKAIKAKGLKGTWAVDDQSIQYQPVFEYYLRSNGKQLYTEDGKLGFTQKDVENWFNMWETLRKAGAIPDAATVNEYANVSLEQSLFAKGKLAMHDIPGNQLYLYADQMKDSQLEMVRHPQGPSGDGEFVEGAYLSITKSSKHPKEAAKFINFFVNSEKALKIFKIEQGAPGSTKMNDYVKPQLEKGQQQSLDFIQKTLKYAGEAPYPPKGNTELTTEFTNAANSIAFGKSSVKAASAAFMKKAESIVNNQ